MTQLTTYAPLLASGIASIAFLSGLWQFKQTQRLTREVKAVELFLKFNELKQQLSLAQGTSPPQASFWQHNALVTITEAVYKLTAGDKAWEETVLWMLKAQQWFLTQNHVNCKSFSPQFVKRLKEAVPHIQCV